MLDAFLTIWRFWTDDQVLVAPYADLRRVLASTWWDAGCQRYVVLYSPAGAPQATWRALLRQLGHVVHHHVPRSSILPSWVQRGRFDEARLLAIMAAMPGELQPVMARRYDLADTFAGWAVRYYNPPAGSWARGVSRSALQRAAGNTRPGKGGGLGATSSALSSPGRGRAAV